MQPSVDTREVRRPLGRGRGIAMLGAAGLKPAPGASVLVSPVDAQGVIVMLIATLPREPVLVECDRYLRTVYVYISVRR